MFWAEGMASRNSSKKANPCQPALGSIGRCRENCVWHVMGILRRGTRVQGFPGEPHLSQVRGGRMKHVPEGGPVRSEGWQGPGERDELQADSCCRSVKLG